MKIESLAVRNFRALRHVVLSDLPAMAVFVGANGSGKSTLFDVLGFLRDALVHNVRQALARRGGFRDVVSRASEGPIAIELDLRQEDASLVTYQLEIALQDGAPIVARETLKYRRDRRGQPWSLLDFRNGRGLVATNEEDYGQPAARIEHDEQQLESADILALKGLGQFQRFKVLSTLRRMIEDWQISDFHISDARPSQEAGYAEHLSPRGDNLPLVARYLYEHHRERFDLVLAKMAQRIPGLERVEPVETEDGRLVLKFQDGSFKDPFLARHVSDGTIKMFAYLLMLYDPSPHPVLCVEEPENQLHPELLQELAEELRSYAERGGQVFVSTHSPDFLNGVLIEEIFWLQKKNGCTEARRASADDLVRSLAAEGDLPGALWKQGFFAGAGPCASARA